MIVDLEYSFGKTHSRFFITAGYAGLLPFYTMYYTSGYWMMVYHPTLVKFYGLIVLAGAIFSLFSFDRVNKFFSFRSQIIYFQVFAVLSTIFLFLIGQYTMMSKDQIESVWSVKNLVYICVSALQGFLVMTFQVNLQKFEILQVASPE